MKRILQMHVWLLVDGLVGEIERFIKVLSVRLVVNGCIDKSVFDQELSAGRSHRFSYFDGNVGNLFLVSMSFCNSDGVIPHFVDFEHLDGIEPEVGFDVVVLGLLEITVGLEGLSEMDVGVLEEVLSVLGDQADHVVVLLSVLVHVDG